MGAYPGIAFHTSLPSGRSDCTLSVCGHELVGLTANGGELRVDLRQAAFERRSVDGGTLLVTTRSPGGPTLASADKGLVRALSAAHILELDLFLRTGGRTPWQRFRARAMPITLFVLFVVGVPWFLFGCLPRIVVGMIPRSVDREIGDEVHQALVQAAVSGEVITVDDPAVREPVKRIVDRLTAVVDRDGFDFDVTVLESDDLNAFALPGGKIVVTTALLESADGPEEVAGVLAHEVSHVTERHVVRGLVKNAGLWMALSTFFGDSGPLGGELVEMGSQLTSLTFSRAMEEEADAEGVQVLARAKMDSAGLKCFLEKVDRLEKEAGSGAPANHFLSTHPVTADRLASIDRDCRRLDPYTPVPLDVDWEALQAALSAR